MAFKTTAGSSLANLVGVMPRMQAHGADTGAPLQFPELGAETFMAGEMVCLSGSSGNRVGITKPGTDASGYGIVGFAADNASGYTSSLKGVWVAAPGVIFVGNVGHSVTSALAQTAATDWGQLYGMTSLSGRTYVDKAKTGTSNVTCRVVGLEAQDVVPSFYGRVYFQVLDDVCQLRNNLWLNTSAPGVVV